MRHQPKQQLLSVVRAGAMMFAFVFAACNNTSGPQGTTASTMQIQSEFDATRVTPNSIGTGRTPTPEGGFGLVVDSLQITSARVTIKDIKLHVEGEDSLKDDDDETLKVGPFVVVYDSAGANLVTTTAIAPGRYDRIKFEIHKYDADHDDPEDLDRDDSAQLFKAPDPYTFVIRGYVWNGGVRSPFTYYSKVTANVSWRFATPITLAAGSEHALLLKLDPIFMFRVIGYALDPRDPLNRHLIDLAIKTAITVWSKY